MKKIFVDVETLYTKDGEVIPKKILWSDGTCYDIDKIVNVCRAASLKVGGTGNRYTCRIQGKEKLLFFEINENKWFVEGK